ncbi:MAG: DUF1501 domain-containing protein [Myxococcota bacterium]|nr:DUF1501 domain-containing protein [Myxococcota bacterium]
MDRREFLKLSAAMGISLTSPIGGRSAHAQSAFNGRFLVTIQAEGGWDPTMLCDPKGRQGPSDPNPINNLFNEAEIEQVGNIRYAPIGNNQSFFQKFYDRLYVLNGIQTGTNNHDTGQMLAWSGEGQRTYPTLAALYAAAAETNKPMAYLSNGGFDETKQLLTPIRTSNLNAMKKLASVNEIYVNQDKHFHTASTMSRILDAMEARLNRQQAARTLPKAQQAMTTLHQARLGREQLHQLNAFLPASLDNSNNILISQVQMAIAAFRAGLTVSVNMKIGSFDTHTNHDVTHVIRMQRLLAGLEYLMDEADAYGLSNNLVVVVASDFGRTPRYNAGGGKDHWPITSAMVIGPNIPGNTVVGASDAGHHALAINYQDLSQDSVNGLDLKPQHLQHALRRYLGIDNHPIVQEYPIYGDALPLLGLPA